MPHFDTQAKKMMGFSTKAPIKPLIFKKDQEHNGPTLALQLQSSILKLLHCIAVVVALSIFYTYNVLELNQYCKLY